MKLKKIIGLCLSAVITTVSAGICLAEKTAAPGDYPNNRPYPAYSETNENGGISLTAETSDLKYAVDGGIYLLQFRWCDNRKRYKYHIGRNPP